MARFPARACTRRGRCRRTDRNTRRCRRGCWCRRPCSRACGPSSHSSAATTRRWRLAHRPGPRASARPGRTCGCSRRSRYRSGRSARPGAPGRAARRTAARWCAPITERRVGGDVGDALAVDIDFAAVAQALHVFRAGIRPAACRRSRARAAWSFSRCHAAPTSDGAAAVTLWRFARQGDSTGAAWRWLFKSTGGQVCHGCPPIECICPGSLLVSGTAAGVADVALGRRIRGSPCPEPAREGWRATCPPAMARWRSAATPPAYP